MRRRLLRLLATILYRFAWLFLPIVALVTAAAVWGMQRMEIETSLAPFLPASAMQTIEIRELIADYRNLEPVMVTIHSDTPGHESELKAMAREMAHQLDNARYFGRPIYRVDEMSQNYYDSLTDLNLVKLMTDDDWDRLEHLMTAEISTERLKRVRAYRLNALLPRAMQPQVDQVGPADPLGALDGIRERLARSRGPTHLPTTRDGYFMTRDGMAIALMVHPISSPENARQTMRIMRYLESCRAYLIERFPTMGNQFTVEFSGSHIVAAQHIAGMQHSLGRILYLSIPMAILLILLVFRKAEAVLFILVPPALGFCWAMGLAAVLFEDPLKQSAGISVVGIALLAVIGAIGVTHAVQLYHRFTLELYRNRNYYRALTRAYTETGRGVLASAVIVSLLFLFLFVSSLRSPEIFASPLGTLRESHGISRLGLVATLGIGCSLAASLLVLPLLAAIKGLLARGRTIRPLELYRFGLHRLYEPAVLNPRMTLLVMLLVTVFYGLHATRLDFSPQFSSLRSSFFKAPGEKQELLPSLLAGTRLIEMGITLAALNKGGPLPPRIAFAERLGRYTGAQAEAGFPRPGRPLIAVVRGTTQEEALEQNDQLYENLRRLQPQAYNILAYDSLRTVLPSVKAQKRSLARLNELDLEPIRKTIQRVSRKEGFKPEIYEPFLESLLQFKQSAETTQFLNYYTTENENLIATAQRYITRREAGYFIATSIYPRAEGFNSRQLNGLIRALGQDVQDLRLIGDPLIERELARSVKYNLAVLILLSIFAITLAFLLHFRSLRLAWVTFLPVACEIVWMSSSRNRSLKVSPTRSV